MGRTLAPYSRQIEKVEARFRGYRRALRAIDQDIFDQLFIRARAQVQAGVMASSPNPMDGIFLSILIEQEKEIQKLKRRLDRLTTQGSPPSSGKNSAPPVTPGTTAGN